MVGKKNIIVIGGSAGALSILQSLVAALPEDFDASLFMVMHTSNELPSYLAKILNRKKKLLATVVEKPTRIEPAHVYLPRSGHHLVLQDGMAISYLGPKENRFRPAIDVLFRTAAQAYGPRVVGVLLSGYLDDGTSGLSAIKEAGGTTVVQDPEDAFAPAMPENALDAVDVDYCLAAAKIPQLLVKLAGGNTKIKSNGKPQGVAMSKPADNPPSRYTCPDCGGTLFEMQEGGVKCFRCRVGHGFSEKSLLSAQDDSVENLLWAAQRALEERSDMLNRLASKYSAKGNAGLKRRFSSRAQPSANQAQRLRDFLEAASE